MLAQTVSLNSSSGSCSTTPMAADRALLERKQQRGRALVSPSSRVMIAPMPSLRCTASGMRCNFPMVASSIAYCRPMRVRQVSQLATPSMLSRISASTPSKPMPLNRSCSEAAAVRLSKIHFRISGSQALIAATPRVSRMMARIACRCGIANRTASCNCRCRACRRAFRAAGVGMASSGLETASRADEFRRGRT